MNATSKLKNHQKKLNHCTTKQNKTPYQKAPNDENDNRRNTSRYKKKKYELNVSTVECRETGLKKDQEKTRKSKQSCKKILCAFISILTMLAMATNIIADSRKAFEITSFKNPTCVKVNQCKNVSFVSGNWNLITYLDMREYDGDFDTLRHNVDHLQKHS